MKKFAYAAGLAVAAMLLSACPGPGASESPSATPSVTASDATPTPSATPTETTAALDCPEWSDDPDFGVAPIDFNRFTGICVGETFADAGLVGEDVCPWYTNIVADDDLGFYIAAVTETTDEGAPISFFLLRWYNDPALASSYEMPGTAEGITIGSTDAQVAAAYPGVVSQVLEDIARGTRDQRIVAGPEGLTYVFDITDGLVSEISWGDRLSNGGPNGDLCAL